MTKFEAIIIGRNGQDTIEMVKFVTALRKEQTNKLALESQKIIRRIIKTRISRPSSTGRLADWAGRVELNLPNGEAGLGNIDDLNSNVPYWRHVNYGSLAINANWIHPVPSGSFTPGNPAPSRDSFRQGRWTPGVGDYIFTPNKPVPAMNYIEATISEVNAKAPAVLARVTPRSLGIFG